MKQERELTKAERLYVLKRVNCLLERDRAGEDVTKELQLCGQLLLYRNHDHYRMRGSTRVSREREYRYYEWLAVLNDIPPHGFESRVKRSWDHQRAATTPYIARLDSVPEEYKGAIRESGVSEALFLWRVKYGWPPDIAATRPPAPTTEPDHYKEDGGNRHDRK